MSGASLIGCCEKIKIGIVPYNHKIKFPFDMGFNKIEKFSKNFNVFDSPQGPKLLKIRIFHENGFFLSECFYDQLCRVSCHILLVRTVQTDKNGI